MKIDNKDSFKLIISIVIGFILGIVNIFLGTYVFVSSQSLNIIYIYSLILVIVNGIILIDKKITLVVIKISSFLLSSFISEIFVINKYYVKICEFVYNDNDLNAGDGLGAFILVFLLVEITIFSIIVTFLISLLILLKSKIQTKKQT